MPGEPLTPPTVAAAIGLTGKLPAHGDFVRRGDGPATARYDRWLSAALAEYATADRDALADRMSGMPPWRFVATDNEVLAGAMIASHDKVGRIYPLIGLAILSDVSQLQAEHWSAQAEAILLAARDAGVTADMLAAALSAVPVSTDPDTAPPHTSWWHGQGEERVEGPETALPTGDAFARLLDAVGAAATVDQGSATS
jgi:type VI secretion system protein ImpM